MNNITKRSITDFNNSDLIDYMKYTIENRAIPSVIDGFKPTNRKIAYVSSTYWKTKSEWLKIFQLTGTVAKEAYYHHGDASMNSAIITMAQEFKNNLSIFQRRGQFGTLRTTDAGAPRYIDVRLDKIFFDVYKDDFLLTEQFDEGNKIEPKFFLPIIPMVLINQTDGIASGFKSDILTRCPIAVINACAKYLITDKSDLFITPKINGFSGQFIQDEDTPNRWIMRGKFTRKTNIVTITEYSPQKSFKDYRDILMDLQDKKKIVSYKEKKSNYNILVEVKLSKDISEKLTDEELYKYLKLEDYYTEHINTLDEFGKLKQFDNTNDIIKYFVDFRLGYYQKRKDYEIKQIRRELLLLANRGKYIKAILDGKISVKNSTKAKLLEDIETLNLSLIDDSYDYLTNLQIHHLTKENFEKIQEQFKKTKQELADKEIEVPKDTYINELRQLKTKLEKLLKD